VKKLLKTPTVVDLRNVYQPSDMKRRGFTYASIGRP
jgi:UDPglucose 6-dehydrogenase